MLDSLRLGAWLVEVVLELAAGFWFVTLPLLVLAAVAWRKAKSAGPGRLRAGWIALAFQGGAAVLLLALGTFCTRPEGREPYAGAGAAASIVMFAAFFAAVMLVVFQRGRRFLVLGTGLLGLWIASLTYLVASMAIGGVWL